MQETWLLWQARRGDGGAWAALYLRHYRRMFRLAALVLGDDRRAEDLTAAAFVTARRDLARLATPLALRLYLCRLVVREAPLLGGLSAAPVVTTQGQPVDTTTEQMADEAAALRDAVSRLPREARLVLALTLAAGLSPGLTLRVSAAHGARRADVRRIREQALTELAMMTGWSRADLRRRLSQALQELEPSHRLWEWSAVAGATPLPPDDQVDLRDRAAPVRRAAGVLLAVAVITLAVLRAPAALKPTPAPPRPTTTEGEERRVSPQIDVTTQMMLDGAVAYSPVEDHAGFHFITQIPASRALPGPIAEEPIAAAELESRLPPGMRLPTVNFADVQDLRMTVFYPTDVFLSWRSGTRTYRLDYHQEVLQPVIIAQGEAREVQALPGEPAGVAYRDDAGAYGFRYLDGNTYQLTTDGSLRAVLELINSL